jgi:hypothetical protein
LKLTHQITFNALFVSGNTSLTQVFDYTTDIKIGEIFNVESFDVYINNEYYGSDLSNIQINTNDTLRIDITKTDINLYSTIELFNLLL